MPPKEKKGGSRSMSKKAKERKEKKLLEERINNSKQKCEEARGFLEPSGKHTEPNFTKATEALEEAVALYEDHALPYFLLGECHRAQGELDKAIDAYSKALDVDPRNTPSLEGRALCYQRQRDIVHAIEDYTSMIEQDPENDHAYNMRGVCLASTRVPGLRLKMADFKRCESDLKSAARLNEANYHALANLGKLYEDQGDLEEALASYTKSLKVKESYTYARFRRGCASLRVAEKILVKDDNFDVSGDLDAEEPSASEAIGTTMVADFADVERETREKLKEEEAQNRAKRALSEAEADFLALINRSPEANEALGDVNVALNLGVCAVLLGELDKATDYYALAERILQARPALVEAEEAYPIENAEQISKVIEIRKNALRRKKVERAQTSS